MFQVCSNNKLYSPIYDQIYAWYCKTFKKLFPDGITGNYYFFLMSTNDSIFLLMENTYCTKLKVSSEFKKIVSLTQLCSTAFPIASHKQHVGIWHKTNLELDIWRQRPNEYYDSLYYSYTNTAPEIK